MKIKFTSNINKIRKELDKYQSELTIKTQLLVRALANEGLTVAQAAVSDAGVVIALDEKVEGYKAIVKLIATGPVQDVVGRAPFYTVLAIEFGAGIALNPVSNPNAAKYRLGVGSYPGQTHAYDDSWFYYDENGNLCETSGVQATMPMYSAEMKIFYSVQEIANTIFK